MNVQIDWEECSIRRDTERERTIKEKEEIKID